MVNGKTIAIASGKGGTGKTTISTNLALIAAEFTGLAQYLDCDVEQPNGALFLKPEIKNTSTVSISVPEIDPHLCTGCGKCQDICQFNAITCVKGTVLTFHELCHSCKACSIVCPSGAIHEKSAEIGTIEIGQNGNVLFGQGILNIGNVRTTHLIYSLKDHIEPHLFTILDAPPGTSCPAVETMKNVDLAILVTEPTPFGLCDLKLAVEMTRLMHIPIAVVINRADIGDTHTFDYCKINEIPILAEIPDDLNIAKCYSQGYQVIEKLPNYRSSYQHLYKKIEAIL